MPAGSLLAIVGLVGILVVAGVYPLLLLILPRTARPCPVAADRLPSVALITAARNAAPLIDAKLRNVTGLDYPADRLTIIVASDGSTDGTGDRVRQANLPGLQLIEQAEHAGKAAALNRAVEQADAELLLFSDADALLDPGAVRLLARHFVDPAVGGVCGQRAIAPGGQPLRDAQQHYIDLDSRLKRIESMHGRVTSNDGKLHMIRKDLFQPIPADVTDDLYTALAVIAQGYRFIFEPAAIATIGLPSRDAAHERRRRRRVVARSLTGIWRMRRVLNPFRYGLFSIGLLLNKVGRRLLPFFFVAIVAGLLRMCLATLPLPMAAAAVVIVLAVSIGLPWIGLPARPARMMGPLRKVQYVLVGLLGTAWGVLDFLRGHRVCVWEPMKSPAADSREPDAAALPSTSRGATGPT